MCSSATFNYYSYTILYAKLFQYMLQMAEFTSEYFNKSFQETCVRLSVLIKNRKKQVNKLSAHRIYNRYKYFVAILYTFMPSLRKNVGGRYQEGFHKLKCLENSKISWHWSYSRLIYTTNWFFCVGSKLSALEIYNCYN